MSSNEEILRRKLITDDLGKDANEKIAESLPMSMEDLKKLFEYLNENLTDCDFSLALTEIFLDSLRVDKAKVKKWLQDMGGYCDCEVLSNVEENLKILSDIRREYQKSV